MFGEKGKNGVGRLARSNRSGIAEFCYSYNGSVGGGSFSYKVSKEDGKTVFSYEAMEYPDLGTVKADADEDVLEKIDGIYLSCRLAEWDGFSKYNTMILDGSGFSLRVRFNDGAFLSASGTNAFPRGYHDFVDKMSEALDPLRDECLKKARERRNKKQ